MYTKFVYVYIKNKKSRKKLKNKKTDRKIQTKKTGHASPQGGPPPPSLSSRALRDAPRGGRCAVIRFFSLLS